MTERIWIVSQMTRLADPYARYFAMGMRYSKLNSKHISYRNVGRTYTATNLREEPDCPYFRKTISDVVTIPARAPTTPTTIHLV